MALLFCLHTENRGDHGFFCPDFFLVPNLRIIEYLSHGMSRRSRGFFVPRLVLGPTDQREVIFEFANFFFFFTRRIAEVTGFLCPEFFPCPEFSNFRIFLHTDCRGIIFFITNYRIIEYLSHGVSRIFFVPNLRIFSSHGMSRRSRIFFVPRLVLGPTDRREVIIELSNIFHTDCRGGHGFSLSRDLSLDPLSNGR